MSNPNLQPYGFQYIIDASGVNNNVNIIVQAQDKINQGQKKVTDGAQSFDRAIGANGRSVRLVAGELTNLAGASGIATSAFTGLLAASGPIDAVIIGIGLAIAALKSEVDRENTAFETQTDQLARLATSYTSYAAARKAAAQSNPLSSEGLSGILNQVAEGIPQLKAFQDAYDNLFKGAPGSRDFVAGRLDAVTKGELALGIIQNERIKTIGEEVTAQAAQGASLSAIFDSVVKLKIATGEITEEQVKNREAFAKLVPGLLETAKGYQIVGQAARDAALAQKIAGQLIDAQNQFNDQSEQAAQQHEQRLGQIAQQGAAERARIQKTYDRALRDIQEAQAEAGAQAAEDRAERIGQAEADGNERRAKAAESYADRRAQIEEDYQNKVRQINQDYASSLLDAVANRDAFALLRAKQTRDKQLKEAADGRNKDNSSAAKDYDKQQKELNDALDKQRSDIEHDYQKRLQQAATQAAKSRAKARESYSDALADQRQSQKDAYASEGASYAARQAQIAAAFKARKAAIIAALADEKNVTETEAKAIIESLKGILKPEQITGLLQDLQKAIQAKIDIKITPFVAPTSSDTGPVATPSRYGTPGQYAMGGFTGNAGGSVDPGEWVIPNPAIAGYNRWQEVVGGFLAHASRTVGGAGGSSSGGAQTLALDINLNSGLLEAQIAGGTMRTVTRINRSAVR